MMRIVIFANGTFSKAQWMHNLLRPDDVIIAADGGTEHALTIGVTPHYVIGDLDSLTQEQRQEVETAGAEIISFPPRKDETDLELALLHAEQEGATEIIILAALGGRLDQTIANVLLLTLPELREIDVRIIAGNQTAFLIQDEALIEGHPGDTISLIPLGGDALGVTAEGVEWALDDATLRFGPARGVSNVLTQEQAYVSVREGLLLCVVTNSV